MFLVGLTGGIASGKSTVSKMLRDLGCTIIDADVAAREVVKPGKKAWKAIQSKFGPEYFHDDGTLDREKLGEVIFADENKRRLLNSITHPEVLKWMVWQILWCFVTGHQFVILDLPLLFETRGMARYLNSTIVVNSDPDIQLERLRNRNGYSATEAQQRINAQLPLEFKCKAATYVIENSHSREETKSQVEEFCRLLRKSKAQWKIRLFLLSSVGCLYFIYAGIMRKLSIS